LFVELEEGIDGIDLISSIFLDQENKHPSEYLLLVGDTLEVEGYGLDVDGPLKLSLGPQTNYDNPWDKYELEFALDYSSQRSIAWNRDKGATIDFNEDYRLPLTFSSFRKEDGQENGKRFWEAWV